MFYGGDLRGIESRLDHLVDLGRQCAHLNPVFQAHSNHKYDVADHDHVDAHFEEDAALASLRQALSMRGCVTFSISAQSLRAHWHPWFQRALADPTAVEAEFFTFAATLTIMRPAVDAARSPLSPELRRRIYEGPGGRVSGWLRAALCRRRVARGWPCWAGKALRRSGWTSAAGIRRAVKETRPDAHRWASISSDATGQLQGDQWDGVANYGGFTHPLWYWLAGYDQGPTVFLIRWRRALADGGDGGMWLSRLASQPWAIARQQYNLLGQHDTVRIRTLLARTTLHRLAVAVLLTFPAFRPLRGRDRDGGRGGLGARGCMGGDEARQDRPPLDHHRRPIAFRRGSSACRKRAAWRCWRWRGDGNSPAESGDERAIVTGIAAAAARGAAGGGVGVATGTLRWTCGWRGGCIREGRWPLPPLGQGALVLRGMTKWRGRAAARRVSRASIIRRPGSMTRSASWCRWSLAGLGRGVAGFLAEKPRVLEVGHGPG